MKSLLIGRPGDIRRVYPDDILTSLREEAGLDTGTILTRDELASAEPADADCLFSTWGMPAPGGGGNRPVFPQAEGCVLRRRDGPGLCPPVFKPGYPDIQRLGSQRRAGGGVHGQPDPAGQQGLFRGRGAVQRRQVQAARRHAAGFPGNVRCKVGIIGAGMIGSMVIRMLHGRELDVLVYDPSCRLKRPRNGVYAASPWRRCSPSVRRCPTIWPTIPGQPEY